MFTKSFLLSALFLSCAFKSIESPTEQCTILDFTSGFLDTLGDYQQDNYTVQFIIDPRIEAGVDSGQLVFSTDSVSFQFEAVDHINAFFDLKSMDIKFESVIGEIFIVGDSFDTLKVNMPGTILVPDSFFLDTTQIHVYGNAQKFSVDNIEVCQEL